MVEFFSNPAYGLLAIAAVMMCAKIALLICDLRAAKRGPNL